MKNSIRFVAAAVAAVMLCTGSSAKADIGFDTAGGFTGPDSSGGNLLFEDQTGTATTVLSIAGAPATLIPGPGTYTNVDFGTFKVNTTGTPGTESLQPGNQLEFVIIENSPTSNSEALFSSTVAGTITNAGGVVSIDFTPGSDSLSFDGGAETFTVNDVNNIIVGTDGNASVNLLGTVTVVPEPASVWLLCAGGGVLLAFRFFRRFRLGNN